MDLSKGLALLLTLTTCAGCGVNGLSVQKVTPQVILEAPPPVTPPLPWTVTLTLARSTDPVVFPNPQPVAAPLPIDSFRGFTNSPNSMTGNIKSPSSIEIHGQNIPLQQIYAADVILTDLKNCPLKAEAYLQSLSDGHIQVYECITAFSQQQLVFASICLSGAGSAVFDACGLKLQASLEITYGELVP